jgi:hypothetical protein
MISRYDALGFRNDINEATHPQVDRSKAFCDSFLQAAEIYKQCEIRDEVLEELGIPFPLNFDNERYVAWVIRQNQLLEDFKNNKEG